MTKLRAKTIKFEIDMKDLERTMAELLQVLYAWFLICKKLVSLNDE